VQREAALDFHRRHVLAPGDDQIINPTGDEEVTVGVLKPGIAAKIPTLADCFVVSLGPAPIALEAFIAGDQRNDFAFFAGGRDLGG